MTRIFTRSAGAMAAVALIALAPAVASAQTPSRPPAKAAAQDRQPHDARPDDHKGKQSGRRFQVAERGGDHDKRGPRSRAGERHDRRDDDRGERRRG